MSEEEHGDLSTREREISKPRGQLARICARLMHGTELRHGKTTRRSSRLSGDRHEALVGESLDLANCH